MPTFLPENWSGIQLAPKDIEDKVKEGAECVCRRREEKASTLAQQLKSAGELQSSITSVSSTIYGSIDKVKVPATTKENIRTSLGELHKLIGEYIACLESLHKRFQNQKIRIISFGSRSQGKSSFTKKYTGLPDAVVAVKGNDNVDKTGATSIIIHKEGVDCNAPEIRVVLRTKQEILKAVNVCLASLSECGFKPSGKTHFSLWDELYAVLSNDKLKSVIYKELEDLKQGNALICGFMSKRSTLLDIFKPTSDFSEVDAAALPEYFEKGKGKPISLSELPKYNDMTCTSDSRYMTVSEILIFVDLKRNGMFENIEVCDTKGMSVDAGGDMWEEELYRQIGNSDAAFSIQMTCVPAVGAADQKFYDDLNDERKRYPSFLRDLRLKHYAILNVWDGAGSLGLKSTVEKINNLNITQNIYVGALKEKAVFDSEVLDMGKFVEFVVYNMIQQVVITTYTTDQNLLNECAAYPGKIREERNKLVEYLTEFDSIPIKEWDKIIMGLIHDKKRKDVKEEITKWAKSKHVQITSSFSSSSGHDSLEEAAKKGSYSVVDEDEDEDYMPTSKSNTAEGDDIPKENLVVGPKSDDPRLAEGVFKMIAGKEEFNRSIESKIKGKDNANEAVKLAIGCVFDKFFDAAGSGMGRYGTDLHGTSSDIGSFIDALSQDVYDCIHHNANQQFAPDSQNPSVVEFRHGLFSTLWRQFHLDLFFAGADFDEKFLKPKEGKPLPKRLENWAICYNSTGGSEGGTPILPRKSYNILQCYFKKAEDLSEDDLSSSKKIVDKDKLREAFIQAYLYHDYVSRYNEKQRNAAIGKRAVLQAVMADLDIQDFAEELFKLYTTADPIDYINKLIQAGLITPQDEDEYNAQKYIETLKAAKTQLTSISI